MTWWWRWRLARRHRNGEAAKRAIQQAEETLSKVQRQARYVDRATERAKDLTSRSDWFTQDMERALHIRRGSA